MATDNSQSTIASALYSQSTSRYLFCQATWEPILHPRRGHYETAPAGQPAPQPCSICYLCSQRQVCYVYASLAYEVHSIYSFQICTQPREPQRCRPDLPGLCSSRTSGARDGSSLYPITADADATVTSQFPARQRQNHLHVTE